MTSQPDHEPAGPLDDFVWVTKDGQELSVADMTTTHLFWSVRMVFNHTVEPEHQLAPFRPCVGVGQWPTDYRQEAFDLMLAEIARRPKGDLTVEQRAEVEVMRRKRGEFKSALASFDMDHFVKHGYIRGEFCWRDEVDDDDPDWDGLNDILNHEH